MSDEAEEVRAFLAADARVAMKMAGAIEDLWSCIGPEEMLQLQPYTRRLAGVLHALLWRPRD